MRVKVQKGRMGYYNHKRRKAGDIFDLKKDGDFSKKWMERVPDDTELYAKPHNVRVDPNELEEVRDRTVDDNAREPVPFAHSAAAPTKTGKKEDPIPPKEMPQEEAPEAKEDKPAPKKAAKKGK